MYCLRPVFLAIAIACLNAYLANADNNKYLFAREANFIRPFTGWILIGTRRVKCGATLINPDKPKYILTAASCAGADIVSVAFGDYNRELDEGTEQVFTVVNTFTHPEYKSESKDWDLAIMELDREATLTADVQAVELMPEDHLVNRIVRKNCRTGGYGYITPEASGRVADQSPVMKETIVGATDDDVCSQAGAPASGFCFESKANATWIPCEGDVGTGIFCRRKRQIIISGVISGFNNVDGCAGPLPKVAIPTSEAINFFQDVLLRTA